MHPTRKDVWGLVINEAMANGLPVITTDRCVAGLELVQNSVNGFIVRVDDIAELREKIVMVIANCVELGNQSLDTVPAYTFEEMALKHVEVLKLG